MKWFCTFCWRNGSFLFDLPIDEAKRVADIDHRHQVDVDMRAVKVPAGMMAYFNTPLMEKYPSVDCKGNIKIGEPTKKKPNKKDKPDMPRFDFGD